MEPAEAPWGTLCRYFHLLHRLRVAESERNKLQCALDLCSDIKTRGELSRQLVLVTSLAFKLRLARASVEANWLHIVRNLHRARHHHQTRFVDPNLLP